MHNLFAFNVSKDVAVPAVSFTYDPDQQVTTWMGDDTVTATYYCTQIPYCATRCMYPNGQCQTQRDILRFTNSGCDYRP